MPRLTVTLAALMLLASCATTPPPAELASGEQEDARGAKVAPPARPFSHIEIGGSM